MIASVYNKFIQTTVVAENRNIEAAVEKTTSLVVAHELESILHLVHTFSCSLQLLGSGKKCTQQSTKMTMMKK